MNDYRELAVDFSPAHLAPTAADIAAAMLGSIGYESFETTGTGLKAYIPVEQFDLNEVAALFADFPLEECSISMSNRLVEGRDWNETWEREHFRPIVVDDRCCIHASTHTDYPACRYDIVIDPRCSFGTGTHDTTALIIRELLDTDIEGRTVLDMGTGTGILAILAAMCGAARVDAIEIDPMAHANAIENCKANNHPEINVALGDASLIPREPTYDILIANINRNIILADIDAYAASLRPGATVIFSGFYEADIPLVAEAAGRHSLELDHSTSSPAGWTTLTFVRTA